MRVSAWRTGFRSAFRKSKLNPESNGSNVTLIVSKCGLDACDVAGVISSLGLDAFVCDSCDLALEWCHACPTLFGCIVVDGLQMTPSDLACLATGFNAAKIVSPIILRVPIPEDGITASAREALLNCVPRGWLVLSAEFLSKCDADNRSDGHFLYPQDGELAVSKSGRAACDLYKQEVSGITHRIFSECIDQKLPPLRGSDHGANPKPMNVSKLKVRG